jgi:hypothetical protein
MVYRVSAECGRCHFDLKWKDPKRWRENFTFWRNHVPSFIEPSLWRFTHSWYASRASWQRVCWYPLFWRQVCIAQASLWQGSSSGLDVFVLLVLSSAIVSFFPPQIFDMITEVMLSTGRKQCWEDERCFRVVESALCRYNVMLCDLYDEIYSYANCLSSLFVFNNAYIFT